MREFELHSTGALVSGPVIETFLVALGAYRQRGAKVVARACGVESMDTTEGKTYPLKGYLASLEEFQKQFGRDFMEKVGALIFEKAIFPPGIDDVEKALALVDTAYHMNNTNAQPGALGSYAWTSSGPSSGTMICDNPFPCAFDQGIIRGIARKFKREARIEHLSPSTCRHSGAPQCTYRVEW